MFSDTIAVNETLRLSPTEKCRYTGYTLNNERLFELVDNNDVKIPVNLGNYPADSVTIKGTDFFPADTSSGSIPAGQVPDYIEASHQHFHAIEDTVTMDRRKPYVFWDASNNIYVGMWTGQKYTNPSNSTTYKNMMFWTKLFHVNLITSSKIQNLQISPSKRYTTSYACLSMHQSSKLFHCFSIIIQNLTSDTHLKLYLLVTL